MKEEDATRYTYDEWMRIKAKRECSTFGHDFTTIYTNQEPISMVCDRPCGHPGYRIISRQETVS